MNFKVNTNGYESAMKAIIFRLKELGYQYIDQSSPYAVSFHGYTPKWIGTCDTLIVRREDNDGIQEISFNQLFNPSWEDKLHVNRAFVEYGSNQITIDKTTNIALFKNGSPPRNMSFALIEAIVKGFGKRIVDA